VAGPMADGIAVQSEEERGEGRSDTIQPLEGPRWYQCVFSFASYMYVYI
jgi:hypothetical protein